MTPLITGAGLSRRFVKKRAAEKHVWRNFFALFTDTIAGKPAPTVPHYSTHAHTPVGAGLPAMAA
jgi:hypothetical protein